MLQYCVKFLIPGVISYTATVAGRLRSDASSISEADHQGVEESFKAYSSLITSFPEGLRKTPSPVVSPSTYIILCFSPGLNALGLLLPVLILLLDPGRKPPTVLHTMAVNQILSWATASPGPFKDATSRLEKEEREILEASVRQAVQDMQNPMSGASTNLATAKPQISLRSF